MRRFRFGRFKWVVMYIAAFIVVVYWIYGFLSALGVVDWAVQRQTLFGKVWNFAVSRDGVVLVSGGIAIFVLVTLLVERRRDASNFRVWQRRKAILESRRRHLRHAQSTTSMAVSGAMADQFRGHQELYRNLTAEEKVFLKPIVEVGYSAGQLAQAQHDVAQGIIGKTGLLTRNGITGVYTVIDPITRENLLRLYKQDASIERRKRIDEWRDMVTNVGREFSSSNESFFRILERQPQYESLSHGLSGAALEALKHGTGIKGNALRSASDMEAMLHDEITRIEENSGLL
jgi:hypothetical protein